MGVETIPVLPEVKFVKEVTVRKEIDKPNPAITLEKELEDGSIEVEYSEIYPDSKGLLTYNGRKVAAFIRDQRRGITPFGTKYRYHLYNCTTLQYMRNIGRETRYFVTKRKDGLFDLHDLSGDRIQRRTLEMELCKNCVRELQSHHLYFNPFSLSKYFERYESHLPKTIKKTVSQATIQTYAPEQKDIAREYKKAANRCCQSCHVNCISNTSLLNLHHCDGDPSNNKRENLRVLCVDCHSKQPLHSQVSHTTKAKEQIQEIKMLRAKQGITDLN